MGRVGYWGELAVGRGFDCKHIFYLLHTCVYMLITKYSKEQTNMVARTDRRLRMRLPYIDNHNFSATKVYNVNIYIHYILLPVDF